MKELVAYVDYEFCEPDMRAVMSGRILLVSDRDLVEFVAVEVPWTERLFSWPWRPLGGKRLVTRPLMKVMKRRDWKLGGWVYACHPVTRAMIEAGCKKLEGLIGEMVGGMVSGGDMAVNETWLPLLTRELREQDRPVVPKGNMSAHGWDGLV